QQIGEDAPVLAFHDLSELAEREALCERYAHETIHRSFDLARGPLLHMQLYRLASEDHVLLLNIHHIIADGWSLQIFFRELAEIYRAASEDRAPNLSALPMQYADFA